MRKTRERLEQKISQLEAVADESARLDNVAWEALCNAEATEGRALIDLNNARRKSLACFIKRDQTIRDFNKVNNRLKQLDRQLDQCK